MEFSYDGVLTRLRDHGREIGRALVEPSVEYRDRQALWDPALFTALAEAGFTRPPAPAGAGGLGLNVLESVALLEGFGEGAADPGLAFAIGVHGALCGVPIASLGTPSQRDRYLPGLSSGTRPFGLALSELDGGAGAVGEGVAAAPAHGGWRLNGAIANVVNAPFAEVFLVTAGTPDGGRTAFLIDRDMPHVAVLPEPGGAVLRTAQRGTLVLTGCSVAQEAVLGTVGAARSELVPLLAALDRTCMLAPWLGLLRALADKAFALAGEQSLFGGSLARSQSVRLAVVDLRTRVELAATLLYRAAWQLGASKRAPRQDAAAAKLFMAAALREAVRVVGGFAGIGTPALLERASRDLLALTAGGGEEVLRAVIAGALLELG